ncbi:MAG: hypothetical protein P1U89_23135 [Verrucomicrobiales bacterium]|nr:hypothetical protein [Verrucomicrobiales bacterium]
MNLTFRILPVGLAVVAACLWFSAGFSKDKEGLVGLLLVGSFEKADITSDVEGAKKAQLAAAYVWKYGVRLFTDESWEQQGLKWEDFSERAGVLADELAAKIKPEFIRNHHGVIDYAIVTGESAFFSSVITSPRFLQPFADTLGDKIHAVVVDRNILYAFPATGGKLADFSPALVEIFEETPMPVSLEVFEIDKNGYRVIGEIDRSTKGSQIEVLETLQIK